MRTEVADGLNASLAEVSMRALRFLFGLVLLGALAFLVFGYWAGTSVGRFDGTTNTVGTTGVDTDRAREKAAELGERAAVASAKAGDAVRDASTTTKITAKMALDDVVKARTIDVSTDGSTVTLSGRVHSQTERDRAVRIARETEGVQQVVDRLRIEP
jgi:hyperosmotically inducible periplasmic protein